MRRGSALDFSPSTRGRTTKLQKGSTGFSGAGVRVNWRRRVVTNAFGESQCEMPRMSSGTYLDLNGGEVTADALARSETGKFVGVWAAQLGTQTYLKAIKSLPRAMSSAFFRCSISSQRFGRNCMASAPHTWVSVCITFTGTAIIVPRGIRSCISIVPGSGLESGTMLSFAD